MAPPLIFPPVEPAPAALTDSRQYSQRKVDAGQCARLPALIAALSSPDPPPPAARVRVVLLPRGRTEPAGTDPTTAAQKGVNGMNQNGSSRHHLAESDGATRAIAASRQWHDVELALKVARHSFERWLVADHEDPPSPAVMHAYHTHETLHEAARVITVLIEFFRVEAGVDHLPARDADIPAQCR